MKLLLTVVIVVLLSCSSNNLNVENRVKNYMSDTVAVRLDDPSSYEFVDMKIDTVKGSDEYNDLKRLSENTVLFDSVKREEMKKELAQMQSNSGYMDSTFKYYVTVNYRAKNKLGSKVLSQMKMYYYPSKDAIQPIK
jgi:hypothetical protein